MRAKKESMLMYYESLCSDGLAEKEDCTDEENIKFSGIYEDKLPDNIFIKQFADEQHEACTYYKYILAENLTQNTLLSIGKK